jgi:hypothetical protein
MVQPNSSHRVRDLLDRIVAVRARVTDVRRQRRATAALDIVGRPVFSFFVSVRSTRDEMIGTRTIVTTTALVNLDFVRAHFVNHSD